MHLGSWRRKDGRPLTYRELADELGDYVADLGFTHVELMPVMEHPFSGSWGYQVTGYYAPTSRFGTPDDFRYFVDRMHERGIGVILDWVPAHFPRDDWALALFDGTHLYEHADPRRGAHPDWGTLVFNLGRAEVRNFLLANALYWVREHHADGIRVDAVASMLYLDYSRKAGQWVPNEFGGREDLDSVSFLKELNEALYAREPGIISAAEESTAWPGVSAPTYAGGLGFGFKWNMGWMHDTLAYFEKDPVHRRFHHHTLTFSLIYAFSENFVLPLSHDEVVHGKRSLLDKMPGDRWQKFANLRALYAYMWAHPGKKLLFMGGELGEWEEWNAEGSLHWNLLEFAEHDGVRSLVRDLNRVYRATPALWQRDFEPEGFRWLEANDAANNVLAFARLGEGDTPPLVCVAQPFAGATRGLPRRRAGRRPLARGAQHRRGVLRRLGSREPRRRRGGADAVERPAVLRASDAAAARRRSGLFRLSSPAVVGELGTDDADEDGEDDLQRRRRKRERELRAGERADRSDKAEAQGEPEVPDSLPAQREAADDRGGEDHEERRRLGAVLREADREHEERDNERPAADAEQPGCNAGEHAERGERDVETRPAHARTPTRTAIPTRKRPKMIFSNRSSIFASIPAPSRAPTIDPAASPTASHQCTWPATPYVAIPAMLIGMIAPSDIACASRWP